MPVGLVLGGGAPNLPLMTGALLALDRAGVDFKVITTTGAGMVVGLLYAAPRKHDPDDSWETARQEALEATREWGIDDAIYRMMPINYKIFQKPGDLARAFSNATNPFLWSIPRESRRQRLLGDGLALMTAMMSPSSLTPESKGLCQPPPWIEMLVDFESLEKNMVDSDTRFRMSAYCIEDAAERTFHRGEITAEHFKAALAMPFIYAPYPLYDPDHEEEKTYLEGSAFNTLELNPQNVMVEADVDTIIFFDIMGDRHLIGEPRWLVDAWGKSIVAPLTRLAELGLTKFKDDRELHQRERELDEMQEIMDLADTDMDEFRRRRDEIKRSREFHDLVDVMGRAEQDMGVFRRMAEEHVKRYGDQELLAQVDLAENDLGAFVRGRDAFLRKREHELMGGRHRKLAEETRSELLRMPFRRFIPPEHWPQVLDWSYSNMSKLFDIGYETGQFFVDHYRERLERSLDRKLKPV